MLTNAALGVVGAVVDVLLEPGRQAGALPVKVPLTRETQNTKEQ